ncbi:MAG TPA: superoxide dismutase, Ni [Candidatus Saccharimonadales bacterium]|nr:superoxide dismutase, Ni [Candidatus Saccharimonadales bacterium]
MKRLLIFASKFLPTQSVYAHCDVPCGIYDPKPAQIAAATVVKMVSLIDELPKENTSVSDRNKFVRCVLTKEEHARKCKEELFILWADYFKPEHLKMFPSLHEKFWSAVKLCSQNKQNVDAKLASDLVKAVDEIADMFAQSKAAK